MTTFKGTSVNAEKGFKDRVVTPGSGATQDHLAVMSATSAALTITSNAAFDTGIKLPPNASIVDVMTFVTDAPSNAVNIQYGYQADTDAYVLDHPLGTVNNTIVSPRSIGANGNGVSSDLTGKADDWLNIGAAAGINPAPSPIWAKCSANPAGGCTIRVRVLYTRPIA